MLPATLSPTVIGAIIRGRIGFEGVLVTDDLGDEGAVGHARPIWRARRWRRAATSRCIAAASSRPTADLLARCPPLTPMCRWRAGRGARAGGAAGACRSTRRRWRPSGIGCSA